MILFDWPARNSDHKPNVTSLADFVMGGEKRYWLHPPTLRLPPSRRLRPEAGIATDRFDGTIVGQQFEEVIE
jgi:hypothetical protein